MSAQAHTTTERLLAISRDPLPHREPRAGKYDEQFAQMEPGDNMVCLPKDVNTMRKALARWLQRNDYPGSIFSQTRGKDGMARVWWMPATPLVVDGINVDPTSREH